MSSTARRSRLLQLLVVGAVAIAGGVGQPPVAPAAAELASLLEPPSPLAASNPRWSPDGRAITFYAETDGQTDIYVQRLGEAPRRLTGGPAFDYGPDFSPDGEWIVFYSGAERSFEINLMRTDGSARRALTATGVYEGNPSFSPDGARIVFTSNRDGNHEVYLMDADGSDAVRLTRNEANDWTPRFSPDGRRIVFASDRGGDFSIWTMAADGSDVTPVADVNVHDYYPDWSPDGSRIAFFSGPDPDSFQIWVADLTGGTTTQITAPPITATSPAWAPDGARLLIGATRDGEEILMTVRPDGSDLWPLLGPAAQDGSAPTPITDAGPSWSPDGRPIIFYEQTDTNADLYTVDGSGLRRLTGGAAGAGPPAASVLARGSERRLTDWPGTEDSPRFSPDGEWLAFHANDGGPSDLYLMRLSDGEVRRLTKSADDDRRPVWSPDGRTLAYQSTVDGVTGIWTIPATGGTPTPVLHREDLTAIAPDFGPDGRLVATVVEPDAARDYGHVTPWLMDADGGNARSLTSAGDEWYARWDAAGEWLYYYDGSGDSMAAVNVASGRIRDVTRGRFVGWRPMPSPDGRALAFVTSPGWTVTLSDVDGDAAPRSLTTVGRDDFPGFSPDGRHIVFSSDRAPSRIVELDLATGSRRELATGTDPEILADGRLAYLSDTKPAELRLLDPRTGAEARIDAGTRIPYRVAHSPSGHRLALVVIAGPALPALSLQLDLGDGGGLRTVIDDRVESPHWCGREDSLLVSYDPAESFRQLFLLEPDTGGKTRLTDSPGSKVITACADDRSWISYRYTSGRTGTGVLDATPQGWTVRFETDGQDGALSPDGRTFAEVRSASGRADLFLRAADGSLTRLTDDELVESTPRWTADGTRLVFAARATQRDLWMIDLGPSSAAPTGQRGAPSYSRSPDTSGCDNCKDFPDAWLHEDAADLLDLASLPPQRRLDFLVGEWELLFPYTNEQEGIHYTTDLPIGYEIIDWLVPQNVIQAYQEWPFTSGGGVPFRARSDLYVFRNITRDRFLAEAYLSSDGGRTYDQLDWRLRYRRRR